MRFSVSPSRGMNVDRWSSFSSRNIWSRLLFPLQWMQVPLLWLQSIHLFNALFFQNLIKSVLGSNFSETVTSGDLAGAHDESKATVPILCFVAGNIDPLQSISSLSDGKLENRNRVKLFTLGRGMVSNQRLSKFRLINILSRSEMSIRLFVGVQKKGTGRSFRTCTFFPMWWTRCLTSLITILKSFPKIFAFGWSATRRRSTRRGLSNFVRVLIFITWMLSQLFLRFQVLRRSANRPLARGTPFSRYWRSISCRVSRWVARRMSIPISSPSTPPKWRKRTCCSEASPGNGSLSLSSAFTRSTSNGSATNRWAFPVQLSWRTTTWDQL